MPDLSEVHANELKRLAEKDKASMKRIDEFQTCVNVIAETLRDVGVPVVCGGVDTEHTQEVICLAIRSLASPTRTKETGENG